ncbi:2-oxoglutarate dehydrogenase E1 subunit family protein, partial [Streptomyces sp. I05A-00742]|uniref:2-oxoglutarate dehydrogenase E1 subunit family protein n=1 Tax=Streptomyces sp. I05A-00742 TaxID=2732853 RepID=UPI0014894E93
MSPQSPNTSSTSTDQDGQGKSPADVFGPNEWLVDEIYQQYLQDPNSVDRAWWDFFADYKPGKDASSAAAERGVTGGTAPAAPAAAPQPPAAPAAAPPAPVA